MPLNRSRESIYPPSQIADVDADIATADKSYDPPLRAITVGVTGTVKVDTPNTTGLTIPAVCLAVGVQHTCFITKIYKVGTTATSVLGWR